MSATPTASIVIPTIGRPDYLEVTLASVVPQASAAGAEVVVVNDGGDPETERIASRYGVRTLSHAEPRGVNGARNAGLRSARSDLVILLDDDVEVAADWLEAMLTGARANPGYEVLGGPIRGRVEGGPRSCGREPPPISTFDFGPVDRDVPFMFGGNTLFRKSAFGRLGYFNEELSGRGDEEEWVLRYTSGGGRLRYLARAAMDHRRADGDARLGALTRAAYAQGREARRHDVRAGTARSIFAELRILAGCLWHTARRRCAYGIVMGAKTAGSLREALADLRPSAPAVPDDFLSGASGQVFGIRATSRALASDAIADAQALALAQGPRLRRAARAAPRRRVLALGIERAGEENLLETARAELLHSHHDVDFDATATGDRGKFENLNLMLARNPPDAYDWLLFIDDDVLLPPGFLDAFLFLAERFSLQLAQPAHRARSHAAWPLTRRRPGSVVRETGYVEIGPVVAMQAATFDVLLPFPELRAGWGLDAHWAALARAHGWRLGIVDATPIQHHHRRIASFYSRDEAIAEGRRFLAERPYMKAAESQRTLATHRTWT